VAYKAIVSQEAKMQVHQTELAVSELKQRLDRGDHLVVLDVRNEEEYANWKVEARRTVPMANIPYFEFIDDEDVATAKVPFTRADEIVVICAKGDSSAYVAGILRDHGYRAANLIGGMVAWGNFYEIHDVAPAAEGLVLLQINRAGKGCLSYLIGAGGEAIVVDPGRHYAQYIEEAKRRGLTIKHVVDTHLHADHISGAPELAQKTGADYHLHLADAALGRLTVEGSPGRIELGGVVVEVLQEHTPGHTPGSTSLIVADKYLISGDTLFVNSVGRPDLGGHVEEWSHDLYWTLVNKIRSLPDGMLVLPAHYASQNEVRSDGVVAGWLGDIRRNNPALTVDSEAQFVAFIKENMRPQPEIYGEIRQVNLGLVTACEDQRTALELGKNQCAASAART
jgi:glyoxylase-like metal-dependent hydrolase (beta-lactamase superfamily II)/rhodanese-related sulfurtransferase